MRAIGVVDDLVLAGTYGSGWYLVKGDQAERLPNDPTNCLDYVHSFVVRDQVLWMSTNRGLVRITLKDLHAYLADRDQRPYIGRYGSASGLANLEFNGGMEPAVCEWTDGTLSYPSLEGVVRVDPRRMPDPYPAADPAPGRILVNGTPWPVERP